VLCGVGRACVVRRRGSGGRVWDIAALVPIVEEAGGTYTTLAEDPRAGTTSAPFTNSALHPQIINITNHGV
jgi:histidinol-phosphatase